MIINQSYLFAIFMINGIIIGILFDIFRILRKIIKFGKDWVVINISSNVINLTHL